MSHVQVTEERSAVGPYRRVRCHGVIVDVHRDSMNGFVDIQTPMVPAKSIKHLRRALRAAMNLLDEED